MGRTALRLVPVAFLGAAALAGPPAEHYVHSDDLYSVLVLSNSAGAATTRHEYHDYGAPLDPATLNLLAPTEPSPPLYTGRRLDAESGWYHYRTRPMDPSTGRFCTRDTLGIWGDAATHGNGVNYAAANPASYVDPFGRELPSPQYRIAPRNEPDPPKGPKLPQHVVDKLDVVWNRIRDCDAKEACENWIEQEKKRGIAWNDKVDACPCKLLTRKEKFRETIFDPPGPRIIIEHEIDVVQNPDPKKWADPTSHALLSTFHPGAKLEMRTTRARAGEIGGHGEQCCYDKNLKLITNGLGAGTADYSSPEAKDNTHFADDVASFIVCQQAGRLKDYFTYRPQNNKNKCEKNP